MTGAAPASGAHPQRQRTAPDYRLCVAPMMEWTDRHCRYLLRLIAPDARLYTEMIVAAAVLRGDTARLLSFDATEHPVALQLGGSDPAELAEAAARGAQFGYDEINLNVGCPSGRVQAGRFGACLMTEPELVARCIAAMDAAVAVPVTVKTRIGVDDRDDELFLFEFVDTVAQAGCRIFIVHARKAVLGGLSPRQNRQIPPLRYDRVERLRERFPELTIVVNGGISSADEYAELAKRFDGCMVGRAAYHDPMVLAAMQRRLGRPAWRPGRADIVAGYLPYVERQLAEGVRLHSMTRHMLGLYHGQPGARSWRRTLSQQATRAGAGIEVIRRAMAQVGSHSRRLGFG